MRSVTRNKEEGKKNNKDGNKKMFHRPITIWRFNNNYYKIKKFVSVLLNNKKKNGVHLSEEKICISKKRNLGKKNFCDYYSKVCFV